MRSLIATDRSDLPPEAQIYHDNQAWPSTREDTCCLSPTITHASLDVLDLVGWPAHPDSPTEGGTATSLDWSGAYDALAKPGSFTGDSVRNKDETDCLLRASQDAAKTFAYEDVVKSYEASTLGTTKVVEIEREE